MRKNSSSNPESDQELDIEIPVFQRNKNIQIAEDPERNMAIVRIYGEIKEPEEYIEELAKLDTLSSIYDVVEITLNSPGGSLNTTIDLASIINNFNFVVTIGKGEIVSAAFMLWAMGDVKVVADYSMYMAHRESYGMYGKTSEHKYTADVFGKVYEEMFEDCFGDILTDEEKMIADRSEAWVSYKDLISREGVISLDEYINPVNPYSISETYITEQGQIFMYDLEVGAYRSVSLEFGDEIIADMTEYLYGISKIQKISESKKGKKSGKKVKLDTKESKKKKDNQ